MTLDYILKAKTIKIKPLNTVFVLLFLLTMFFLIFNGSDLFLDGTSWQTIITYLQLQILYLYI